MNTAQDTTSQKLTDQATKWARSAIETGDFPGTLNAYLDRVVSEGHLPSASVTAFENAYFELSEAAAGSSAHRAGWVAVEDLLAEPAPRDVLIEPLVPRNQITSFVGPKECGKSFLAFQMGVARATGRSVFDTEPQDPIDVMYLDWENSKRTQARRLKILGYEPGAEDTTKFHYSLFPECGSVTTKEGADEVLGWIKDTNSKFVIVDTLSRAFHGEVTNPDVNQCYINFVMALKRMEDVSLLWLDHTGHDETRARDASSKGQLWEVEWVLSRDYTENRTSFRNTKDREGWFPPKVDLTFGDEGFEPFERISPDEAKEFARQMDLARCPTFNKVKVREFMKELDYEVPRATVVQAAITYRKHRNQERH